MRVENWNWREADEMVAGKSVERLRKAAKVIAANVKRETPVGTISRPMYKSGPYAGQPWTARDAGALKKSVRVVERKKEKSGTELVQFASFGPYGIIRVYAGHYLAYYADIVEYSKPFFRPAVEASKGQVGSVLENG